MPLPKVKEKITLEEVGAPELFVEWRILGGVSYREVREIFGDNEDENADGFEAVENMFSRLITNWNIPEVDGGTPLPLPRDNKSVIGDLPAVFVNYIANRISASSGFTGATGEEQDLESETASS